VELRNDPSELVNWGRCYSGYELCGWGCGKATVNFGLVEVVDDTKLSYGEVEFRGKQDLGLSVEFKGKQVGSAVKFLFVIGEVRCMSFNPSPKPDNATSSSSIFNIPSSPQSRQFLLIHIIRSFMQLHSRPNAARRGIQHTSSISCSRQYHGLNLSTHLDLHSH